MYIKYLELHRFKSFGNTTGIPLLPGFTVVSGPNGSGKSNILDALLFALGLSSSKGMRADRLPDLVNQSHLQKGRTAEVQVKVCFAIEEQEWWVARKLRVTQQGTYTSTYYINDSVCTLSELHEQLSKFHIYPEGYNIVLQGDVTGIISMSAKERRGIIDELAGVGEFDRKIAIAKEKLEEVKLETEKFQVIEQELISAKEKLQLDRQKAEKYQALKQELEQLRQWEVVVRHGQILAKIQQKEAEIQDLEQRIQDCQQQLQHLQSQIVVEEVQLQELQQQVSALGESEYLALTTAIVTSEAERQNLGRQKQEVERNLRVNDEQVSHTENEIQRLQHQIDTWQSQLQSLQTESKYFLAQQTEKEQQIQIDREAIQALGSSANEYLQQQQSLYQQIDKLQTELEPQKQELVRLEESLRQWHTQLESYTQEAQALANPQELYQQIQLLTGELKAQETQIQMLAGHLSELQSQKKIYQETSDRLWQEQRQKSRQLDKLEAEQQVTKEVQGTRASQLILHSNLQGIHGMVAQLGKVNPTYQLALEICAGNRLSFIVVEDDYVASQAIQLLKQERAGRCTFLPLNKMRKGKYLNSREAQQLGAIDYALNLVEFADEYLDVFYFIFSNTLVFKELHTARRHLGNFRMVTLEGELLETTGAMAGGSISQRDSLHFGRLETADHQSEINALQSRLTEIDTVLQRIHIDMQELEQDMAHTGQKLTEKRQLYSETQRYCDRLQQELSSLNDRSQILSARQQNLSQSISIGTQQREILQQKISIISSDLQRAKQRLADLEATSNHTLWHNLQQQSTIHQQELQTITQELHKLQQNQQQLEHKCGLALNQIDQLQQKIHELHTERSIHEQKLQTIALEDYQLALSLQELNQQKEALLNRIGEVKNARDDLDRRLRQRQNQAQEINWQIHKQQETKQAVLNTLQELNEQLATIILPDPPPPPPTLNLIELQEQERKLERKLQALEPVNMLAIQEYEATAQRLEELTHKLETLCQERTELLLRIENFTTLRQRSFMEAFAAVNENFQTIFAELSDGDGHLQLENPQDPLNGGLNLVAHPKGKPVQHLSSMSGGEKSLTALSFIFALQKYRPSPFYAFDEVDMFLDGANVEKLARMVKKQSQSAQFIVVSLRRPMIDRADRVIGVTQARGAHTQVLGFENQKTG